jgi:hypothetical protein
MTLGTFRRLSADIEPLICERPLLQLIQNLMGFGYTMQNVSRHGQIVVEADAMKGNLKQRPSSTEQVAISQASEDPMNYVQSFLFPPQHGRL